MRHITSYFVERTECYKSLKLTEFWQVGMILTGWVIRRHASWTNVCNHMEPIDKKFHVLKNILCKWGLLKVLQVWMQTASSVIPKISYCLTPLQKVLVKKKKTWAMDSHVNISVQLMLIPHGQASVSDPFLPLPHTSTLDTAIHSWFGRLSAMWILATLG